MKKYDCIIVGAGPAGVAAAKILKDNNINYCVIEKEKFPREKLCGGGLTNKSVNILKKLGIKIDNLDTFEAKDIKLISKKVDVTIPLDNPIIMVDRTEFDTSNIKQVTTNNLYEGEKVINFDNNILTTDKDEYEFKYLILADGLNGFSRKLIKKRQFGFCLEFDADIKYNKTILDFCAVNKGYGWVFPKHNKTTVGIGHMMNGTTDYIKTLDDFANKYGFKLDKTKIKGYHIPIFSLKIYNESVINNNTIIVGDAASLVNQMSGEGIYYALASGMNAALSIIECLNNNHDLKETYFKKNEGIIHSLNRISKASKLLYSKHGNFYIKIALKNQKAMDKIKRVLG